MQALLEILDQVRDLIIVLEQILFGTGFLFFVVFEFACFFRFLLRKWREDSPAPRKPPVCSDERFNNGLILGFFYVPKRDFPQDHQAIQQLYLAAAKQGSREGKLRLVKPADNSANSN